MPWGPDQATRFTKKAKSKVAKKQWSHVADSELMRGLPEGQAIAAANSVIKKRGMASHSSLMSEKHK